MNKMTRVILFLVILSLGLACRMTGLDRSFVLDEFRMIKFCNLAIGDLLETIKTDSYPPLSYIILSWWIHLSRSETWIRLLFIIFGMLSVVLVYLIGKELVDSRYALIAMFIISLMPIQVWVSQYVRGIAPAIFFILLSTLFFLRLVKSENFTIRNLDVAGYLISSTLAIYSFYFAFFIITSQSLIYIFLNRKDVKNIFKWALLQFFLFLSFLPWLKGFLEQLRQSNIFMNFSVLYKAGLNFFGLPIGTYMRGVAGFLGLDQTLLADTPIARTITPGIKIPLVLIFLAFIVSLAAFWVFLYKRFVKEKCPNGDKFSAGTIFIFFSIFAITPLIASIMLNILFKTPVTPRYFAISSAFLTFVYALTLFSIKKRKIFYLILTFFIAVSLVRLVDYTKTAIDYKNSAVFLKNNIRDEEFLLFVGGENAYDYYGGYPRNYIRSPDYVKKYGIGSSYLLKDLIDEDILRSRLSTFGIVWIYNSGEKMTGIVNYVIDLLERFGYKKIEEYEFKNISIFKYAKQT